MLTVTLLRHAKSSWDNPQLVDFDRPLGPRGANAARRMADLIAESDIRPDLIRCSSARRTRETLDYLLPRFTQSRKDKPEIVYDDDLYLANAAALLSVLRALPRSCRHVMLIGHNPGLHALALDLIGEGPQADIADIVRKFPTAALAVIAFDSDDWRKLEVGAGKLTLFATPRRLAA
jgi:phosphohistidine phosphatase